MRKILAAIISATVLSGCVTQGTIYYDTYPYRAYDAYAHVPQYQYHARPLYTHPHVFVCRNHVYYDHRWHRYMSMRRCY